MKIPSFYCARPTRPIFNCFSHCRTHPWPSRNPLGKTSERHTNTVHFTCQHTSPLCYALLVLAYLVSFTSIRPQTTSVLLQLGGPQGGSFQGGSLSLCFSIEVMRLFVVPESTSPGCLHTRSLSPQGRMSCVAAWVLLTSTRSA